MDYSEILEKSYQKSEELIKCKAALRFLQYLFENTEDKKLVLDEKQYRMIMDMAGIKVDKEIQIFWDNSPKEVAYEQKLRS